MSEITVRAARTPDVAGIFEVIRPLMEANVLVRKDLIVLYESVQEFCVAENAEGDIVGCGALHVLWRDLGEIRTIATTPAARGQRVGHRMLEFQIERARELGLARLFCLTFETDFFAQHGFVAVAEQLVDEDTFAQMRHSRDTGVAEFLDLPWVKPNTLGNTRMILTL